MNKPEHIGKRVGGFVYIHKDALHLAPDEVRQSVSRFEKRSNGFEWNVAKVSPKRLSLLLYEDFSSSAFPALLRAMSFDEDGQPSVTDYTRRDNPPILHRKETLLSPDDPRVPAFVAITRKAEEKGLFKESNRIGNRKNWEALLEGAGLRVIGAKLVSRDELVVNVARDKTAMWRSGLSQPVSLMIRFGMLRSDFELFDYGCGRGDDVAALQANGYSAFGWDPNHKADGERRAADVVNLGFVLNVVEDPHEREETLKAAWSFAKRGMAVAVMIRGKYSVQGHTPVSDGYLSSRQTFQKYFSQDELMSFVQQATGERPVVLGGGIVAVFKDKDLEQQVGFRRRSRSTIYANLAIPERERAARPKFATLSERVRDELEAIWLTALGLGRLPLEEEVAASVLAGLLEKRVSFSRALSASVEEVGDLKQLEAAASARREDLIVHFALSLFPGAVKYSSLPNSIQRDVRTFFGSHANVMEAAKAELTALMEKDALVHAYADAAKTGYASFNNGILRFMADSLEQLPIKVRIVAGCAELVHQGFSLFDLVEINPEKGSVKGLECDITSSPLPSLRSSVTVNLARSSSWKKTYDDRILYLKSRFLHVGHPGFEKQAAVDKRLREIGLVDDDGKGPPASKIAGMLKQSSAHRD